MPQATDPCANGGTPAGNGSGGAGGAGTSGGAGATPAAAPSASDGINGGNNVEALATSKAVVGIGASSKLAFAVETTLLPARPGVSASGPKLRAYRNAVTAAALRIRIVDAASQGEWDKGSKQVRATFVTSFLTFLQRRYPKAVRSVTIVDANGDLLAVGDAPAKGTGQVTVLR